MFRLYTECIRFKTNKQFRYITTETQMPKAIKAAVYTALVQLIKCSMWKKLYQPSLTNTQKEARTPHTHTTLIHIGLLKSPANSSSRSENVCNTVVTDGWIFVRLEWLLFDVRHTKTVINSHNFTLFVRFARDSLLICFLLIHSLFWIILSMANFMVSKSSGYFPFGFFANHLAFTFHFVRPWKNFDEERKKRTPEIDILWIETKHAHKTISYESIPQWNCSFFPTHK